MTVRAKWNGRTIAESDDTVVVEQNHYFPLEDVSAEVLQDSDTTSECPWKGTARYHDLKVDGETLHDGAWYYPDPKDAASQIKNRIAFWKGVEVEKE
ncbi:DUF427 domain-containing protein [Altererythrobacter aurantiacus]|uniref:DUF427 domain-containing protein n=1 Tax=Parapontixanthobacter aurantiacus TaxID=1463599 RepID=A0A844ZG33_9SPHN|nr:DUF427 domain-containing protein [Parapontixanthobacter aurantiacus]MXO85940.1 DUF427 domain-containing protein [Parapontixanthobacter aurantiacus]